MSNPFIIVSIEGNIGSGKSTLLANLREHYANDAHIVFLKEPVDEWEKIKKMNNKIDRNLLRYCFDGLLINR